MNSSALSCREVFSKPEQAWGPTYHRDEILRKYEESRDLSDYLSSMPPEFFISLMRLLENQGHLLDAGSGQGRFSQEVAFGEELPVRRNGEAAVVKLVKSLRKMSQRSRPSVTAVTARSFFQLGRHPRMNFENEFEGTLNEKLRVFAGRLFEQISNRELMKSGEVDLIVDMWGVMAYSHDLNAVLAKYHEVLKPNGEVYIRVHSLFNSTMMKDTVRIGNREIGLVEGWLPQVEGFKYEIFRTADGAVVRLTKNSDHFIAPQIAFVEKDDQLPPVRKWIHVKVKARKP